MSRAQTAVLLVRAGLICLTLLVAILVLGPFQGAEQSFGLNDKEAHIIAFFALTVMLQMGLPQIRKMDLALLALLVGAAIEVVQLFTGRSASVTDWLADGLGILFATAPAYAETFRIHIRSAMRGETMPRRRASDVHTGALARVRANKRES